MKSLTPELNTGRSWEQEFRDESLESLAKQLRESNYPNYPAFNDRLWLNTDYMYEPLSIPLGKWETSGGETPTIGERLSFSQNGVRLDIYGRPLHPWFEKMVSNPDIGILTGKGFYRRWGANFTADPIVIRRDSDQTRVLLIKRNDTGRWALPGGFIDGNESAVAAAVRETREETGIDLRLLAPEVDITYSGPVADPRTTANAWAETTAVSFEIPDNLTHGFKDEIWEGGDDAKLAAWVSVDVLGEKLFGSHLLMIKQVLRLTEYSR